MLVSEIRELKTGRRELRKFGLLVGGVFAALGILSLARHKPFYPWLLAPGLALMILGLILPRLLRLIYIAWMSFAIVLGFIVSSVLLILLFVLVMTPIGLVARLVGKDFLRLKLDPSASTYWITRLKQPERPKSEYERQY